MVTLVITLRNGDEIRRHDVETFDLTGTVLVIYVHGVYGSETFTNVCTVSGSLSKAG